MKAAIIDPSGQVEVTELTEDLQTLQKIVGGWLEAIYGAHDERGTPQVIILCNEEARIHNLALNRKATALWHAMDPMVRDTGKNVLGTVIVVGGAAEDGSLLSIPDEVADMLINS